MSDQQNKYTGPTPLPTYGFGNAPDLNEAQKQAARKPDDEEDFEIVHVYPPIEGMPRLGQK